MNLLFYEENVTWALEFLLEIKWLLEFEVILLSIRVTVAYIINKS